MKAIHKYPISLGMEADVEMPSGARVIHVGNDPEGKPHIWAVVETDMPMSWYTVLVIGTGWSLDDVPLTTKKHVGSFVDNHGLMLHVFVEVPAVRT